MSDLRKEMQTLADRINVSYLLTANCGGPTERNLTQREFDLILIALRMAGVAQKAPDPDYFELAGELGTRAMMLHDALESIVGWRKVNLQGEYDHGLRDIIRSITDCAEAALEAHASLVSSTSRGGT